MDSTDLLLQDVLVTDDEDRPTTQEELATIKTQILLTQEYQAAKKTIIRDADNWPVAVEIEGFGRRSIQRGEDGLMVALSGMMPVDESTLVQ